MSTPTETIQAHEKYAAKPGTLFTPHDAILAELHGRLAPSADPVDPSRADTHSGVTYDPTSSAIDTSLFTSESVPAQTLPAEVLHDPSTGQRLGSFVPVVSSGGEIFGAPARGRTGGDELWSHLSRILDLQSEIAGMHVAMEGVGTRSGRARSGSTVPEREKSKPMTGTARNPRRRGGTLGGEDDEDEGDGDGDSEYEDSGPEKRKREEEFAQLSERFAERKDAIGSIMNKLDDLSVALKTFHALPTPTVDLTQGSSSRSNTVSSDTSALSSSPHFAQTASMPALSMSTSPPPRLLGSVASTGDIQHMVDSPLDMHPAQSFALAERARKS
ncbi:hypothetical protein BV22DRAFT_1135181 [Leucogyrophana mollusca]|uniref:Uncharacterized protein n=1 Tax=Leucogyrophana mollusca TaxID=85980 RepID=A0ACB8AWS3_9AGAM|nr:hypothetical protein BV22DRAFT_1135181 [Leucogyrophana mollusca]